MIAFIDQYIFRFAKLQSVIGEKLFKSILICSAEEISDYTFLDILARMEKFGIIGSTENWLRLRDIRNNVSHDYPVIIQETVESLNALISVQNDLEDIMNKSILFIHERKLVS